MTAYAGFMTHVTCRLTAKNRDQPRSRTLGNRVGATFTFSNHSPKMHDFELEAWYRQTNRRTDHVYHIIHNYKKFIVHPLLREPRP